MSLGIAFKGAEGIVLAADSRVTLTSLMDIPGSNQKAILPSTFDLVRRQSGRLRHARLPALCPNLKKNLPNTRKGA
jgi:hypothetical protein